VLEQVSEPAASVGIVFRPHVVPDLNRDGRAEMVLDAIDPQAVGQRALRILQAGHLRLRPGKTERGKQKQDGEPATRLHGSGSQ